MYRKTFEHRLQEAVFSTDMSMRDLARSIGKRYPTLMRELNPWDTGAKLSAADLVAIVRATGDRRILDLVVSECGID